MLPDRLSLYIHIPWCRVRCGYCDFNTYVLNDGVRADSMRAYREAIGQEIRLAARTVGARRVSTVYFGGGTPSLMPGSDYRWILDQIRGAFDVDMNAEITTEANPETLSPSSLEQIRCAGVNRLSLGMQSAVPHVLAVLDRVHTPGRVSQAVDWARAAGFANLSLDLIYGAPFESMSDWETSLQAAIALEPEHISAYSLIVEEGTALARRMARGELPYPDEDDLADKYVRADEAFLAAGLEWYEVSNWAKPGYECRHNMAYWRSDDWWGIGAGAHSFVNGTRWWNHKRPETYIAAAASGSPAQGSEHLTDDQARIEKVMLGMRLAEGVDTSLLTDSELARAGEYVVSGHLVRRGSRLVCTLSGRLIADGITREILD